MGNGKRRKEPDARKRKKPKKQRKKNENEKPCNKCLQPVPAAIIDENVAPSDKPRKKRRKVLAERRKPLNVDHLDRDKIVVKIKELYDYLFNLEGIKYDYEGDVLERQKDEIVQRRARAQRYSEKLL